MVSQLDLNQFTLLRRTHSVGMVLHEGALESLFECAYDFPTTTKSVFVTKVLYRCGNVRIQGGTITPCRNFSNFFLKGQHQ